MTTLKIFGVPVHVDHSRTETIELDGPITVSVAARSGQVHLISSDRSEATVQVTTVGINTEWMVEESVIAYDPTTKTLRVATPFEDSILNVRWRDVVTKGYGKRRGKFFQAGSDDVDFWIHVPNGSTLDVKSASGEVSLNGTFGQTRVSVVSGDVDLLGTYESLNAEAVSGDITVGAVQGVGKIKTVSGDVAIAATGTSEYELKTISGDIELRVQSGLTLDVDAYSLSGDVSSAIPLDSVAPSSSEGVVAVSARSTSGDIIINRL